MPLQGSEVFLSPAESDTGTRIDKYLAAARPGLSRTEVQRLIKAGEVLVNDAPVKASYKLETGDNITLVLPEPENTEILPEAIAIDILYEDDDLAIINKPAGMVVHPAFGNREGTLVNAALVRWPQIKSVGGDEERAGIVHRLDKDTSGVIVVAKHNSALANLQAQFKNRTAYKKYLALVEGVPSSLAGVVDAPIGRSATQRKRMAVKRDGREAVTQYEVLEDLETHALLSIELKTGRTHQIRVHMAWLGNPVVGDSLYGYRKQRIKMKRLFLHAAELQIDSPTTGERMTFTAPLPGGLENVLAKLRRNIRTAWE